MDAGGVLKRDLWSDIATAAADGTTITATGGVFSVAGTQNIDVTNKLGDASYQLQNAGMNFSTASLNRNVTYTLPRLPAEGDVVYIKLQQANGFHAVISGSAKFNATIDGQSTVTASSDYAGISLCYVTQGEWRIF